MKKLTLSLVCLSLISTATISAAQTIPAPLQKALSDLNLSQPSVLENGTLLIAFNFDSIETLQAKSAVESVCIAYFGYEGKPTWKAGNIKQIYVTNDVVKQGYIYHGGDKSCDEWGKTTGDSGSDFINSRLTESSFKPTLN